jgi:hypothetical protein
VLIPGDATRTEEAAEYLEAARCKVAIAGFHHEKLEQTLRAYPPDKTALQAHFEGLFYAGVAAFEKLIPGLAVLIGFAESARPAEVIAQLKTVAESQAIGRELELWTYARSHHATVIWDEANDIRNAATHRFYDKQQGPPGHFAYSVARRTGSVVGETECWLSSLRNGSPTFASCCPSSRQRASCGPCRTSRWSRCDGVSSPVVLTVAA